MCVKILKNTSEFLEVTDPFVTEIWIFMAFYGGFFIFLLWFSVYEARNLLPNFLFISWILLVLQLFLKHSFTGNF